MCKKPVQFLNVKPVGKGDFASIWKKREHEISAGQLFEEQLIKL